MAAVDVPIEEVAAETLQQTIPKPQTKAIPISPSKSPSSLNAAATSPALLRSSSPRLHSPASSEIFERSVQEPIPISTLEGEPRAHLATHVITEDHIPPALEASVQAITSQELNADEVEIVTSSSHQTALEVSTSQLDVPASNSHKADDAESISQSGLLPHPPPPDEDSTSTYGSIDPNDVRRLSFISFADVVHSEHQHPGPGAGDAGRELNQSPSASLQARSRSPLRSPPMSASQMTTTPPAGHTTGVEQSPPRHLEPGVHGELTIETMRQAVRKTASGDIGQKFKSPATSPMPINDVTSGIDSRTNT